MTASDMIEILGIVALNKNISNFKKLVLFISCLFLSYTVLVVGDHVMIRQLRRILLDPYADANKILRHKRPRLSYSNTDTTICMKYSRCERRRRQGVTVESGAD
jgi:hypothetical protein